MLTIFSELTLSSMPIDKVWVDGYAVSARLAASNYGIRMVTTVLARRAAKEGSAKGSRPLCRRWRRSPSIRLTAYAIKSIIEQVAGGDGRS